ncbi:MAG: hypothetical protein MJZ15_09220 [Bacteroidales bacterium]|nr:hypothetical protein [Bacteroidales bacterium]
MNCIKNILSVVLLLAMSVVAMAQSRVEAQLDSMTIVIGGQVGFNVQAQYPEGSSAVYKQLADSLTKDVEIVKAFPIDTAVVNGYVRLQQRYIVTSFDSGLHYIPQIAILEYPDGSSDKTPDMALNVVNPFQNIVVDQQTQSVQIFDVKDVKDSPFILAELLQYLPWIIIGIVVLAAVVAGIYYYRKYLARKSGKEPVKPKYVEPCDVVALRDLNRIKEEKLWQKNMFKEHYSAITDALRRYISDRYNVNAMESTTDETLDSLADEFSGDTQKRDLLRSILEQADFVKFAKYEPLPDENDMAVKHAIEFVEATRQVKQEDSTNK